MVQRCCFCIGLRTGTFIISIFAILLTSLRAFGSFKYPDEFSKTTKILSLVTGVLFLAAALISIGGFYGAFSKNHGLVKLFSLVISVIAMTTLVLGAILIIYAFINQKGLEDACIHEVAVHNESGQAFDSKSIWAYWKRDLPTNSTSVAQVEEDCHTGVKYGIAFRIVLTVLWIVFLFYLSAVVSRFGDELKMGHGHSKLSSDFGERGIGGPSNLGRLSTSSQVTDYHPEKTPPRGIRHNA